MKSLILLSLLIFSRVSPAALRTSLTELLQGLPESEITQEFRKSTADPGRVRGWLEKAKAQRQQFKAKVSESLPFVRGEIEQEKVMSSVSAFLQLSILQCRIETNLCGEEMPLWFHFASDMAFEESTLIALRFSSS